MRYWVVGGEYRDSSFRALVPGTEAVLGPYKDHAAARTAWTRMTFRDGSPATARYSIAVGPA